MPTVVPSLPASAVYTTSPSLEGYLVGRRTIAPWRMSSPRRFCPSPAPAKTLPLSEVIGALLLHRCTSWLVQVLDAFQPGWCQPADEWLELTCRMTPRKMQFAERLPPISKHDSRLLVLVAAQPRRSRQTRIVQPLRSRYYIGDLFCSAGLQPMRVFRMYQPR